jgi:thymidylate synthase (FAD)
MAQLNRTVQKLFRPIPNLASENVANHDVVLFSEACRRMTIEQALTEFAARVCYNSVKKIGTAPNFVANVLKSGHLSTAEHAAVMLPVSIFDSKGEKKTISKAALIHANRFFDFPNRFVAGNMRSWIEAMTVHEYNPVFEFVVAVFPSAFDSAPLISINEAYEFADEAAFNVPAFELGTPNVYLLAMNRGDLGVSRRATTVLEMPWTRFTWLIEGVSRSLTHQLVRHRGLSFSQESQRYVDFQKGNVDKNYPPFILPEGITREQENKLLEAYRSTVLAYEDLRKVGLKKEDARFVLPNAASTRLVVSASFKDLYHFLDLRCAKDAQWEIQRLARLMAKQAFLASGIRELEVLLEKHNIE